MSKNNINGSGRIIQRNFIIIVYFELQVEERKAKLKKNRDVIKYTSLKDTFTRLNNITRQVDF